MAGVWVAILPADLGGEVLGEFSSPEIAARAYDTRMRSLGDSASDFPLNFGENPHYRGVKKLHTLNGIPIYQAVVSRNGFYWAGSYASPEEAALAFDFKLEVIVKRQREFTKSKRLFNFPARLVAASAERIKANEDMRYSGYTERTGIAEVCGVQYLI